MSGHAHLVGVSLSGHALVGKGHYMDTPTWTRIRPPRRRGQFIPILEGLSGHAHRGRDLVRTRPWREEPY